MKETLVGAGISIITLIVNFLIEKYKNKLAMKQTEYQTKREVLKGVYEKLISIINQYPNSSPNDILKWAQYAPHYSLEAFSSVVQSIDYMIEDYSSQLKNPNISNEKKCNIKTQILNFENSKSKINEVSNKYCIAQNKYTLFCESDKVILDLYAGQDVRNRLVEFEVLIHNVFVSGYSVGDIDDSSNNSIDLARRSIIDSMRKDLGCY